jgi:hypothetical protein
MSSAPALPVVDGPAVVAPASAHEDVLAGLRHVLTTAAPDVLPDVLGRVASEMLRGEARLRRLTSETSGVSAASGDELLTLPQVAEIIGVPSDYTYTLARQRKLPTVRLPGLDRGGRTTAGKYVRVRRADLVAWLARHADDAVGGHTDAPRPSRDPRRARVGLALSHTRSSVA